MEDEVRACGDRVPYAPRHVLALPEEEVQVRFLAGACCSQESEQSREGQPHTADHEVSASFCAGTAACGGPRSGFAAEGACVGDCNRRFFVEHAAIYFAG